MSQKTKELFKENKFGIRKFTVGVASVIVGTTMYVGLTHNEASAAELNKMEQNNKSTDDQSKVDTSNKSTDNQSKVNTSNETSQTQDQLKVDTNIETSQTQDQPKVDTNVDTKQDQPKVDTSNDTNQTQDQPKVDTNVETKQDQPKVDTSNDTNQTQDQPKVDTNVETSQTQDQPKVDTSNETSQTQDQLKVDTSNKTSQTQDQPKVDTNVDTKQTQDQPNIDTNVDTKQDQPKVDTFEVKDNQKEQNTIKNPLNINTKDFNKESNQPTNQNNSPLNTQANTQATTPRFNVRQNFVKPTVRAAITNTNLTNDKYQITSLTGKNVKGNASTKDTYQTSMHIKLDDSVKGGDTLSYGVGYKYKDLNGQEHQVYLPSNDNNTDKVTNIIYNGTNIGTMTVRGLGLDISNPPRDFSVDQLDGTNTPYYANKSNPVIIKFNDNINNLKDVTLDIDNVWIKDKTVVGLNSSTINNFAIEKGYTSDNIVRNTDGTFVNVPNSFNVNGENVIITGDQLQLQANEVNDKVQSEVNNNKTNIYTQTTNTRTYTKTPDGSEYVSPDEKFSTIKSISPKSTPTNEIHYHVVIPKALQDKADFEFVGVDNATNKITFNKTGLEPKQLSVTASSKYNPTTFDNGVYTGNTSYDNVTTPKVDWNTTRNLTKDADGNLVYDVTFKTKDGSYINPSSLPTYIYGYTLKDELKHNDPETYTQANAHPTGSKWGIDEWDKLLAANPIQTKLDVNTDSGLTSETYNVTKESYVLNYKVAQTAPEGAIRVAAVDEKVQEVPHNEPIPFETVEKQNPNKPLGYRKIIQPGVNGEHTWTEKIFTKNGVETARQNINDKTTPATNEIVEVGTGVVGEDVKIINKPIPFETTYIENKNKPAGYEQVVTEGEEGNKQTITKTPTLNGQLNGEPTSTTTTTKEPINKVIERGTGVVGEDVKTVDTPIPFETQIIHNPKLPQGYTNVKQEGQDGISTTTTKTPTLNGEPNGDAQSTTTITKEPINKIIEVGDGVVSEKVEINNEPIPFKTKTIEDKSIPKGQTIIVTPGQNGIESTTKTTPMLNGEPNGDVTIEKSITKEPVDEIIHVGTGVVSETVTKTPEIINHTSKTIENPDLPKGKTRITQKGVDGEKVTITKTPILNGEPNGTSVSTTEVTKEPIDEIIEVGTSDIETKIENNAESKPFEIIKHNNPNLPKGKTRIVQQGKNGITVTTIEQDYVNGKKYGEPRITTTTTQEKVDEIIEIGTKEPDHPVEPLKPTNGDYEPKGGHIDKPWGAKTTKNEIKKEVTIPNYKGDKPLITIDNPKQIPNGNTPGDYSVSITVKYPDGSTDHTIVTIHVGNKVTPEPPIVDPNKPSQKNLDHNQNHNNIHNIISHSNGSNNTINNKYDNNYKNNLNNNVLIKKQNESPLKNVQSQEQIKDQVITQIQQKYNISQKEVMQKHEKEINQKTQEKVKQQNINELPKTGNSTNTQNGLISSLIAVLGLSSILLGRRKKKNS